jgi:hypothetical protein
LLVSRRVIPSPPGRSRRGRTETLLYVIPAKAGSTSSRRLWPVAGGPRAIAAIHPDSISAFRHQGLLALLAHRVAEELYRVGLAGR